MPDLPATAARGRCHCGGVRFVARFPSRFNAHCHCASCRRAHGAAFVTWVGFPADQVEVTQGADLLATHESSPQTFRHFCRVCGTKLFFDAAKWPGETHVVLAAFDEPVDRAPSVHAFYAEHADWLPPLRDVP
ncbi:MAG: GFA family protein [Burkholderiales bacterium]